MKADFNFNLMVGALWKRSDRTRRRSAVGTPHATTARRLAEGRECSVDRCPAGCLHLHIGAVTVRLSPQALGELTDVLVAARAALAQSAGAVH